MDVIGPVDDVEILRQHDQPSAFSVKLTAGLRPVRVDPVSIRAACVREGLHEGERSDLSVVDGVRGWGFPSGFHIIRMEGKVGDEGGGFCSLYEMILLLGVG